MRPYGWVSGDLGVQQHFLQGNVRNAQEVLAEPDQCSSKPHLRSTQKSRNPSVWNSGRKIGEHRGIPLKKEWDINIVYIYICVREIYIINDIIYIYILYTCVCAYIFNKLLTPHSVASSFAGHGNRKDCKDRKDRRARKDRGKRLAQQATWWWSCKLSLLRQLINISSIAIGNENHLTGPCWIICRPPLP